MITRTKLVYSDRQGEETKTVPTKNRSRHNLLKSPLRNMHASTGTEHNDAHGIGLVMIVFPPNALIQLTQVYILEIFTLGLTLATYTCTALL